MARLEQRHDHVAYDDARTDHPSVACRRFDLQPLREPRLRQDGFLAVQGFITRAGVFEYRRADGSVVRELRRPEEVFNQDSLDSFALVPLTLGHPPENLTPDTVREWQVGAVSRPERSGSLVRSDILITRKDAIDAAQAGTRQLSCGYSLVLVQRGGTWTDDAGRAHRFDAEQTRIRGNHVALVPLGRAGPEASIRLDASDGISVGPETMKVRITYEVEPEVAEQMRKDGLLDANNVQVRQDSSDAALKAENERLKGQLDAANARVTTAEQAAQTARADASGPAIQRRIQLIGKAAAMGVTQKFDELTKLSEREIMAAAIVKHSPTLKLEGRSDEYVGGIFDSLSSTHVDTAAAIAKLVQGERTTNPPESHQDANDKAYKEMQERMRKQWQPAAKA